MAAGSSRIKSARRGAYTGQGAEARREGQAPLPSLQPYVQGIESLEEICGWLGTFRERLRIAHTDDQPGIALVVRQLEARYLTRRGERCPGGRLPPRCSPRCAVTARDAGTAP